MSKKLQIGVGIAAIAGVLIAAVALIPAFGEWLTPRAPSTSTPTSAPMGTLPPPSVEIFPQAKEGEAWAFWNNGGLLSASYVVDENCRHSGPYGLWLMYDMKVGEADANGGWGVHWANAPAKHFDASGFSTLTFWVKGTSGGEIFQIGIKDTTGREVNLESEPLTPVSTGWVLVTVPLTRFSGAGVNTASIDNVHIGFNRDHGSGTICFDGFGFEP